jgi:hypothetical protein
MSTGVARYAYLLAAKSMFVKTCGGPDSPELKVARALNLQHREPGGGLGNLPLQGWAGLGPVSLFAGQKAYCTSLVCHSLRWSLLSSW